MSPRESTLGLTAIGLKDRREVKLFRVGDGDETPGENRLATRGEAAGEEEAEAEADEFPGGIDSHSWSV